MLELIFISSEEKLHGIEDMVEIVYVVVDGENGKSF